MSQLCKRCLLREAFPADYEKYVETLLRRIPQAQKAAEDVYRSFPGLKTFSR